MTDELLADVRNAARTVQRANDRLSDAMLAAWEEGHGYRTIAFATSDTIAHTTVKRRIDEAFTRRDNEEGE